MPRYCDRWAFIFFRLVSTDQDSEWCLEVIDQSSMSHVWSASFKRDREALEAVMITVNSKGAVGVLKPQTNVVAFPTSNSIGSLG